MFKESGAAAFFKTVANGTEWPFFTEGGNFAAFVLTGTDLAAATAKACWIVGVPKTFFGINEEDEDCKLEALAELDLDTV